MKNIHNWIENEFSPWKEAMLEYQNTTESTVSIVKNNAAELKYIVSLLLEKREKEAVKIWNNLELNPALESIKLNIEKDSLVMNTQNGNERELSISALLNELQELLDI